MVAAEEDLEYFLLRNYKNLGMTTRRVLIETCFRAIKDLGTPKSFLEFTGTAQENEKSIRQIQSMFQIEIITKIMFLIEDLIIIAESLRQKQSYYSLLKEDVGKLVGDFVKNLDFMNDEELCRIMSYILPDSNNTEKDCMPILQKHINSNLNEIRRALKMIGEFGIQHHPIFKRFKHAGVPMLPGMQMVNTPDFFKSFDFHMLVSIGDDPLNDVKIIPYSQNVLEGYKVVYNTAQKLLFDIIENRLSCIQKQVGYLIPQEFLDITKYSTEEISKLKSKIERYCIQHHAKKTDFEYHSNPNHDLKDYTWYLNLKDFLTECEKNVKIQEEYAKKLQQSGFDIKPI